MSRTFVHSRLRSFRFAFAGLRPLFATQPNFRIHLVATVIVVATGIALRVSTSDWLWFTAAIVGVLVAEALNTALEFLADPVSTDHHPLIANAKDCAAAAVLLAAAGAVTIGMLVFGPHVSAI